MRTNINLYSFSIIVMVLFCSCNKTREEKSVAAEAGQAPMIYTLVDKYKDSMASVGEELLYFNIYIFSEGNDTLLTISGSPYEEYYYIIDKNLNKKKDSVFLIKRKEESIILYMPEPEQKAFVNTLTNPTVPRDVSDYVYNFSTDEYLDKETRRTYIYHQDGVFEFLRVGE